MAAAEQVIQAVSICCRIPWITCSAAAMTVLLNEWAFYQPQATKYQADASLGRDTYSWPLLLLIQLWAERVHQQFSFIGDDAFDSHFACRNLPFRSFTRHFKEPRPSFPPFAIRWLANRDSCAITYSNG